MAQDEITQEYLTAVRKLEELTEGTEVEALEQAEKYWEHMRSNPTQEDIWKALYERYGNICGSAKVYLAKGLYTPEMEAKHKADFASNLDHIFGPNKPQKVLEFQELISRSWQTPQFYLEVKNWLEAFRQEIIAGRNSTHQVDDNDIDYK